jgi:hypothetical protein
MIIDDISKLPHRRYVDVGTLRARACNEQYTTNSRTHALTDSRTHALTDSRTHALTPHRLLLFRTRLCENLVVLISQ